MKESVSFFGFTVCWLDLWEGVYGIEISYKGKLLFLRGFKKVSKGEKSL